MFAFEGERRRCVAMPLGGVGTGNLAIHADGSLRQWQIHNRVNHVGYVPFGFFAVKWRAPHLPAECRLLQTDEFWEEPGFRPAVSVSDHYVPGEIRRTLGGLPRARSTSVAAAYPVMQIEYELDGPLAVRLIAWSPLVPGDADESGYPAGVFDFELTNTGQEPLDVAVLSSLQNAVGWDGASLIRGIEATGYGGNRNRRIESGVALENVLLPEDHPSQGQMVHVGTGGVGTDCPQYADVEWLWQSFSRGDPSPGEVGPSAAGRTWNSAIARRDQLAPGETKRFTFVIAWHFPNRFVDWGQWSSLIPAGKSRFYLGNRYAHRGEPTSWIGDFVGRLDGLREQTLAYRDQVHGNLPESIASAVGSCVANLRTNVCLWTEDGRFYGFEGGEGASTGTGLHGVGGCCPMNCTHVWNYEQGLVELWPDLFRTMRDSDWRINQAPDGQLPHRITLPVYVRKLWDTPIGGPENPALDGLFAGILKTYQYHRARPNAEWLMSVWPNVRRAMEWVMTRSDTQGDGVIRGEQPNTYDIHLYGPNTFIGSQYLAALLAMEQMAGQMGEDGAPYRERFESGQRGYDETCFNGEYYVQRVPEGCDAPYQFGDGCVTDQLLGQWWAHHLDLGYVLPKEHVRSAAAAVFRRNFRRGFARFKQEPRVFASDNDAGLLIATYEPGQRPAVPLLYSDEVWTGLEYSFAALCLYEGLREEGLEIVAAARARYDGCERNPFNEVECGDHYIRALSAWSLPKAWRA